MFPMFPCASSRWLHRVLCVAAGALALSSNQLAASVTIVPVPVPGAPYTNATQAYSIRVEDAANSSVFQNVDLHVHKVRYPNTLSVPPATGTDHDLVTNVYYAHFSFGGGPVKVKITLKNYQASVPLGTYTPILSPKSYGITPTIDPTTRNLLSFTLSSSRYLMLKVTDN